MQARAVPGGDGARRAPWIDAGPVEGFAGVDVAHAGQTALVKQPVPNRRPRGTEAGGENFGRELGAQGFGSQAATPIPPGRRVEEPQPAETTGVVVDQLPTRLEVEPDGRMRHARAALAGGQWVQAARHAEVHHEVGRPVQHEHHVLAPSGHVGDRVALQVTGETCGGGFQHVVVLDAGALHPCARHHRTQAPDDGFGFGKLWHYGLRRRVGRANRER